MRYKMPQNFLPTLFKIFILPVSSQLFFLIQVSNVFLQLLFYRPGLRTQSPNKSLSPVNISPPIKIILGKFHRGIISNFVPHLVFIVSFINRSQYDPTPSPPRLRKVHLGKKSLDTLYIYNPFPWSDFPPRRCEKVPRSYLHGTNRSLRVYRYICIYQWKKGIGCAFACLCGSLCAQSILAHDGDDDGGAGYYWRRDLIDGGCRPAHPWFTIDRTNG